MTSKMKNLMSDMKSNLIFKLSDFELFGNDPLVVKIEQQ